MISAVEAGWKVTDQDLKILKSNLVEILNDSFCEKLNSKILVCTS